MQTQRRSGQQLLDCRCSFLFPSFSFSFCPLFTFPCCRPPPSRCQRNPRIYIPYTKMYMFTHTLHVLHTARISNGHMHHVFGGTCHAVSRRRYASLSVGSTTVQDPLCLSLFSRILNLHISCPHDTHFLSRLLSICKSHLFWLLWPPEGKVSLECRAFIPQKSKQPDKIAS